MSVRKELEALLKVKQEKGESMDEYITRIVDKGDKLFEKKPKAWDELSEEAQEWMNEATEVVKEREEDESVELPDFPDDDDEEDEKPVKKGKAKKVEEEEEDDEEDEKPVKKGKAKKVEDDEEDEKPVKKGKAKKVEDDEEDEKPVKKTKKEEVKPKKAQTPKGQGASTQVILYMVDNPDADLKDIMKYCDKKGWALQPNTVRIRHTIVQLIMNHLKETKRLKSSK